MMKPVFRIDDTHASPVTGKVVWDWPKALWNLGMLMVAAVYAVPTASWETVALFLVLTYTTLLFGHSVGMHRLMIHQTFKCPTWLEKSLIYIGVLVGFAGPYGIIRTHDLRDWAQRQPTCHDFFAHTRGLPQDVWWQLTHRFVFTHPPVLTIEDHYAKDPFYQFLDRTWRWHQAGLAGLFYLIGGWSWVVWGVCLRVFVSVAGHWTITYFCHNPGPGRWRVKDAAVQASNLPALGLLTYGECWHNNHHAFPESARIGLEPGQLDPAWWIIQLLARMRLVSEVGQPRSEAQREDLLVV